MTKLSDTQASILSQAAQRPDGLAVPPESLPPAPRGAVAKRLLEAGLVEVFEASEPLGLSLACPPESTATSESRRAPRLDSTKSQDFSRRV